MKQIKIYSCVVVLVVDMISAWHESVNNNLWMEVVLMNQRIRMAIKDAGLRHWEVAERCGVSEYTFVRWLRHELPTDREQAILTAIESLKGG